VKPGSSLFWQWFAVACCVGVVALQVSTVVREGVTGGTLPGVLLGVVTVAIIVAPVLVWDSLRLRSVRAAHPEAFVANFLTYPELALQLHVVAGLMQIPLKRLRYAGHSTVVVDSSGLVIVGGVLKPEVLFSASGLRLLAARVVSTRQGLWVLPCLELDFEVDEETVSFDLCLLRSWYGFPRVVPKKMLEQLLPKLGKFVVASK
jgi:hypothetical protein